MRFPDTGLLFGAGIPLLAIAVGAADRRGLFARDAFGGPARRVAALSALVLVLVTTVLVPAAVGTEQPLDPAHLSFAGAFVLQILLAAFLLAWWLLAGRPEARSFLGLNAAEPAKELGRGFLLGLLGWGLTLGAAAVFHAMGLRGPEAVPPLVRWLAALAAWQKALVVLSAMTVEEFFFRAFLQARLGAWAAAVLFILSHGGYGDPIFLAGIVPITAVLAWSYARTGNVLAPVAAHGTFNAIQLFVALPAALRSLPAG